MSRQPLLGSSLVGAADQALLSAFNLAVALAFIRFTSKPEYATYALATTARLLLQSAQNALVSSPLATLAPAAEPSRRHAVDTAGRRLQQQLVRGTLALGVALAALAWLVGALQWAALLAACTVAALGLLVREYRRAQWFLRHDAWAALRADALYAVLAMAGLAALLYADRLSTASALVVIGLAGLLGGRGPAAGHAVPSTTEAITGARRAIWDCARWALPGVLNSWLYANAYLFLVERLMSKDAVADLSASRLLVVPMSLLVIGWATAFRPRAARLAANGQADQVDRESRRSALAFVILGLAYGAGLVTAFLVFDQAMLGERYAGVAPLGYLWLLLFTVQSVRSVAMSAMLVSPSGFKTMFRYGSMALLLAAPAVALAALAGDARLVLLALTLAEGALCAIVWLRGWPHTLRGLVQPPALDTRKSAP